MLSELLIHSFLKYYYGCLPQEETKRAVVMKSYSADSYILKYDMPIDKALMLYIGSVYLVVPEKPSEDTSGMVKLLKFQPGQLINPIETKYRSNSIQNIYADSQSVVLEIDVQFYQQHMVRQIRPTNITHFLTRFLDLSLKYIYLLEMYATGHTLKKGSKVFTIGDKSKGCYCITEGEVALSALEVQEKIHGEDVPFMRKKTKTKEVLLIYKGEMFGFEDLDGNRTFEAVVRSHSVKIVEFSIELLRFVCFVNSIDLELLAKEKLRLIDNLNVPKAVVAPRPSISAHRYKLIVTQTTSVFYNNSTRSSEKAATYGRQLLPHPSSPPLPTNMYEFNCMRYGTGFRKKKSLYLLQLLKRRYRYYGRSPYIQKAREAIRRCYMSPYELMEMRYELTGGQPGKQYYNELAKKQRARLATCRKKTVVRMSESISEMKHRMLLTRRLKTETGDDSFRVPLEIEGYTIRA